MAMALSRTNVPVTATSPDQREVKCTAQAIEDIAVYFSCPLSEVEEILKIHVYRLDQQARIKQYVSLLPIKQVKEELRANQRSKIGGMARRDSLGKPIILDQYLEAQGAVDQTPF